MQLSCENLKAATELRLAAQPQIFGRAQVQFAKP